MLTLIRFTYYLQSSSTLLIHTGNEKFYFGMEKSTSVSIMSLGHDIDTLT